MRDHAVVVDGVSPPSGTVMFLFTDVEGSTARWERHADAMRSALETHDRLVASAIAESGGYVFSRAGDSYAAAFARACGCPIFGPEL